MECRTKSDRYPVLYLLHGAGGDERSWIDRLQANVILDNLLADDRLEPFVVVMPYGYTRELAEGERRRGPADYKLRHRRHIVQRESGVLEPADRGRHRAQLPGHAWRAHGRGLEPLSLRGSAAAVLTRGVRSANPRSLSYRSFRHKKSSRRFWVLPLAGS